MSTSVDGIRKFHPQTKKDLGGFYDSKRPLVGWDSWRPPLVITVMGVTVEKKMRAQPATATLHDKGTCHVARPDSDPAEKERGRSDVRPAVCGWAATFGSRKNIFLHIAAAELRQGTESFEPDICLK